VVKTSPDSQSDNMLWSYVSLTAVGLLSTVLAMNAPGDYRRMNLYTKSGKVEKTDTDHPTWHDTIHWSADHYGVMDYPRALQMAELYFRWVVQQPNAWSSSGNIVV